MNRKIITIENRVVCIPEDVKMNTGEIADLFEVYYQTAKRTIRTIEKSGIACGDYSMSCTVEGQKIYPDYYGLEMIIAVAFRVQSTKVEIFREWVIKKIISRDIGLMAIPLFQNAWLN